MSAVTPLRVGGRAPVGEPEFLRRRVDSYYADRRRKWPDGRHILVGRTPGPGAVRLQSNDYLCLASHPRVLQMERAVAGAVDFDGVPTQVMAAVFLHGDNFQSRFEQGMAELFQREATVLCQSGWAANVGLLQAIAAPGVPVYSDVFAHMSLWEGIRAAGAQPVPILHNNPDCLEKYLRRHGPGFVVVDSVYSTSGSVAPLAAYAALARRYDCVFIVDESHSLGTHGPQGAGLVAELGLNDQVHFITASLAKAFAGRAGIVACSGRLAEFLKYHSNPAIFSSGLLPTEIARLQAIRHEITIADERRRRLVDNSNYLRSALARLGYDVSLSKSQIIGLEAGDEWRTMMLRDALEARAVFGSVFCAPATPMSGSLIRLTVNSGLTRPQLDHVIAACAEIRDEVGLADWPSVRRSARRQRRVQPAAVLFDMAASAAAPMTVSA